MSRSKAMVLAPVLVVVTALAALLSVGCEQLTPEQKVAQMRSRYEATVNTAGFVVRPHAPEVVEPPDDGTGEGVAGEEVGGEVGEVGEEGDESDALAAPAEPTGYDVTVDILVSNRNSENLSQLTIDVIHTDGERNEKGRYQVTIDASGITKGGNSQVAHTLENIPFEEGDGFTTEVRNPVPDGEKSKYPELANAGQ
jgi:hypothetical protein